MPLECQILPPSYILKWSCVKMRRRYVCMYWSFINRECGEMMECGVTGSDSSWDVISVGSWLQLGYGTVGFDVAEIWYNWDMIQLGYGPVWDMMWLRHDTVGTLYSWDIVQLGYDVAEIRCSWDMWTVGHVVDWRKSNVMVVLWKNDWYVAQDHQPRPKGGGG